MKRQRMIALLVLLAAVLVFRWLDPIPSQEPPPAAAAVDRPRQALSGPHRDQARTDQAIATADWPVRSLSPVGGATDAFYTRSTASNANLRPAFALPVAPVLPSQPAPTPPAPSPPPVQAPQIDILGTWHQGQDQGVFINGPQGTLLLRPGDKLSAQWEVKQITPGTLELMDVSNQHIWRVAIPTAPSSFATWPAP
jgi:hypothetical protein